MDGTSYKPIDLDNPKYLADFFSKWEPPKVGGLGSNLRGGQRDVSHTYTDVEIEIKVRPLRTHRPMR